MNPPESSSRRALLQHIGLLLGAAALPAETLYAAAARSQQRFLDAPTFRLLSAACDTFVPRTDTPGAVQAGIPRLIDALLRDWASAPTRASLLEALRRIDAAAIAHAGQGFARLRATDRHALLTTHDAAAIRSADTAYGQLKELVVVLYYSSKTGLTKELPYEHAPGKWQPSIPVTKDTRPFGGGVLL